jgi:hypothetical protein
MTMTAQIFWGSVMLGLCSAVHILALVVSVRWLKKTASSLIGLPHWGLLLCGAFAVVVLSHTAQVWMWAISFIGIGAFGGLEEAIYFGISTYTTVGYGDITLGTDFRIYASMAAVTGLLSFGMSTAYLVGLLANVWQRS